MTWFRLVPGGSPTTQNDEFADWGTAWPAPGQPPAPFPAPHSPEWDLMMLGQYAHEMANAGREGTIDEHDAAAKLLSRAGMSSTWIRRIPAPEPHDLTIEENIAEAKDHWREVIRKASRVLSDDEVNELLAGY